MLGGFDICRCLSTISAIEIRILLKRNSILVKQYFRVTIINSCTNKKWANSSIIMGGITRPLEIQESPSTTASSERHIICGTTSCTALGRSTTKSGGDEPVNHLVKPMVAESRKTYNSRRRRKSDFSAIRAGEAAVAKRETQ